MRETVCEHLKPPLRARKIKKPQRPGGKHINPRCKISIPIEEREAQGFEAERLGYLNWAAWVKACLTAARIRGSV